MKFLMKSLLILAMLITAGGYLHAQEPEETVMEEEENIEMTEETTTEDDSTDTMEEDSMEGDETMGEGDEAMEEELSEEELEEILEEAEEISDEDLDDLGNLEGEVIAVTDDSVVIETEDGEIITVSLETYQNKTTIGGGGKRRVRVGEKIEVGSVSVSDSGATVTTNSGTYNVPNNAYITRNGSTASLSDVRDGDEATVVLDRDGNLVAIELIGEIEKASNILLVGTIIAIVVIILLALFFRRKKGADTI